MTDKVIRIFRIINAIQSNPGITAADLAFRCEVNIRTIYRDLEVISHFAPVTNEGRGTGYRFMGKFFLYPLDFSEQESLAFSLLPSVLNPDRIPPGFHSAYDKVMGTHLKEKSRQNGLLENIADIIQMGTPAYRKESRNFLQPLIGAILEQRSIRTVYHSQSRNATTARKIDPYYLIPRDQRFYLIGYCHLKGAIRTFRISRFEQVEMTASTFDKGNFNIKKYLKNTWSINRGTRNVTFKVRFDPEVARYIKEEELFVQPRMSEECDGTLLFEVTVNNEKEFIKWILQYGPNAEILEPESARERLKEQLEQWLDVYQQ
ncbi:MULTISPECIES: WYL domain-containing protein [Paenibacillus]|uniref:DNA-binding transcriptional regulator YafY n=1 Tax=Paenibacillus silagei TaxID=1670801 RepID=A0ABS4NWP5_9BACL|nr:MULTISPECIES: WYL domain-containing protein [Paenibacillus]ETT60564.1 helix-turn-helix type 11 domain-containing protein [Paenibacillus sp. FSL R7-277]MBP2114483.1 putative DNA-binding transcriptional regulator YafY [Paenibacillus silagei]OMF98621.1 transcriptional regulator [Paenibacillus sp. FSL R7-0333]